MRTLVVAFLLFASVVGLTTWLLSTPAPWHEGEDWTEDEL